MLYVLNNEDKRAVDEFKSMLADHINYHSVLDEDYRIDSSEESIDRLFENVISRHKENRIGVYLYKEGVEIVGFAIGYYMTDYIFECDKFVLEFFYVKEEYRGTGIGTNFMYDLEEHVSLSGCEQLELDCYAKNFEALNFYRDHNFKTQRYILYKNLYKNESQIINL